MERKRPRASRGSNIHTQVVRTDASKFRKVVQQLTGMPKPEKPLQLVLKPVARRPIVEQISPDNRVFSSLTTTSCFQTPNPSLIAAEDEIHFAAASSPPFLHPRFIMDEDNAISGEENDIFSLDSEELWQFVE
ncbi:hypothetical protein KI387_015765, partial [Taxus chinensis]